MDQEKKLPIDSQLASSTPSASLSEGEGDFETGVEIQERSLIRKLDIRLLPALSILYLLSFLDRSNVANARLDGLTTSLHMTGNQYLTGLTLYFVGYVLFEIPCQIVLKKTTPRFWLPTLTLAWGVVATLLGVVQNMNGFFAARFFLGVTESGLFPGVIYYLSLWYKRKERTFRVALFFSAASLAGAFGGILAFGIGHISVNGWIGWRWIFIVEGLLTIVLAGCSYFFITNYPATTSWLSAAEKRFIYNRLKADSDASNNEGFTWHNVALALKDPKCYLYAFAFHTMSLPLYTLSLFLPSIIKALGFTAASAQLLTIPPYALATILTVVVAFASERTGKRSPYIIATSSLAIIGYILLLTNHSPLKNPGRSYAGTFLAAAGIYPSTALVLAWPAANVSGQTKRAVAGGLQIGIGNLGAVIGTQLYRANDGPRYIRGHSVALGYLAANICVVSILWFVLSRENKRRESIQVTPASLQENGWEGDDDLRWRFNV